MNEQFRGEIATREAVYDFVGALDFLPDPDPVLWEMRRGPELLRGIEADDVVSGAIENRQSATLERRWDWHAGSEQGQEPTDDAMALRDMIASDLPPAMCEDVISEMLDAPFYGTIPVEIIYREENGMIRIDRLGPKPTEWFIYDYQNRPRLRSNRGDDRGIEIPEEKFVFLRHRPRYKNPYGKRILSDLLWPVTFKRGGLKFWIKFCQPPTAKACGLVPAT